MSKQPRDDSNYPIPLLSFRPHSAQHISFTAGSATLSATFSPSVRVISLFCTEDCYIELGDASIQADSTTSHFIPTGIYLDISLGSETDARQNYKYLSVIGASTSGVLHISERE